MEKEAAGVVSPAALAGVSVTFGSGGGGVRSVIPLTEGGVTVSCPSLTACSVCCLETILQTWDCHADGLYMLDVCSMAVCFISIPSQLQRLHPPPAPSTLLMINHFFWGLAVCFVLDSPACSLGAAGKCFPGSRLHSKPAGGGGGAPQT